MNIIESPNKIIKEDRVDNIFVFLSGNINQELINYLYAYTKNIKLNMLKEYFYFAHQIKLILNRKSK